MRTIAAAPLPRMRRHATTRLPMQADALRSAACAPVVQNHSRANSSSAVHAANAEQVHAAAVGSGRKLNARERQSWPSARSGEGSALLSCAGATWLPGLLLPARAAPSAAAASVAASASASAASSTRLYSWRTLLPLLTWAALRSHSSFPNVYVKVAGSSNLYPLEIGVYMAAAAAVVSEEGADLLGEALEVDGAGRAPHAPPLSGRGGAMASRCGATSAIFASASAGGSLPPTSQHRCNHGTVGFKACLSSAEQNSQGSGRWPK